jgi:DNA-binding MarR family transcriptional regulator
MQDEYELKLVQDYVNLLGKMYIILLSSIDEFLGVSLSTNEKIVLQILDEKPVSIKEISLMTGLALSTLTNVIDKMEEKHLVRRRPSRTDRRMIKIELKAAGRRAKEKFNSVIRQVSSSLLSILSEEDRAYFVGALQRTALSLSREADRAGDLVGTFLEPLKMTLARQFNKKKSPST